MEYEDRLTITTPEGIELTMTLAGAASRFVSAFVDLLIQSAILIGLLFALGLYASQVEVGAVETVIWAVVSFLIVVGYDIFFEVLNSGRTPGKMLNGLRVVRTGGHPVGFLSSAIRNVLRPIDFLPTSYLLGAVLILATKRNQRVGDLVAGTIVVRERLGHTVPPPRVEAWSAPVGAVAVAGGGPAWDTSRITPEELATVRQFLERRGAIDPGARAELARTLDARLRSKVTGVPSDMYGERFLELLAAARLGAR